MDELTNIIDKTLAKAKINIQTGVAGNSVLPASGYYGPAWNTQKLVVPQGLSSAGWSMEARGALQQTFLGGSIRSFNMNGGFGDSSSNLTVELVNDEFNESDKTGYGQGIDEYHGGQKDFILPPIPGTPVYFKFGEWPATVEEAYRKTFDLTYGYNTIGNYGIPVNLESFSFTGYRYGPSKGTGEPITGQNIFRSLSNGGSVNLESYRNPQIRNFSKGQYHLTFGGILQSFLENRSSAGNPLYSVQITDPREILSNCIVLLNNYAGSTYREKNIFNVYGFLEFNLPKAQENALSSFGQKNTLKRLVLPKGEVIFTGEAFPQFTPNAQFSFMPLDCYVTRSPILFGPKIFPQYFPITGTGFSRRSPQGIPWYRVEQALGALMNTQRDLSTVAAGAYTKAGFGGVINFRGHNYVVDFSGLPRLPDMYFLDFDQINLLDLCLEICDVTNRELFVSLLPVINHPGCKFIYDQNIINKNNKDKFISGIIRIDTIDKSAAPNYGSVKQYLDNLANDGILVENQDLGYELSNVVTNKFVVGAQEVDHYFFSANHDRDVILSKQRQSQVVSMNQWLLEHQLEQQILPYYGLLGNAAVTIPKGWGAYQQILLDTTALNANGVGSYYVATEMELRYASISYKAWSEFLVSYNEVYMEAIDGDLYTGAVLNATPNINGGPAVTKNETYAVTVPRSVFDTYAATPFDADDFPSSPCNPPYGYPLYYNRASRIGIPTAGLTRLSSRLTAMISLAAKGASGKQYKEIRDTVLAELDSLQYGGMSATERNYYNQIRTQLNSPKPNIDVLNSITSGLHKIQGVLPRLAKKGTENAMKVYEFVKKVADENLGKKFLVKMPQKINTKYDKKTLMDISGKYTQGPFGFRPIAISEDLFYQYQASFWSIVSGQYRPGDSPIQSFIKQFLSNRDIFGPAPTGCVGAFRCNYNPIADKFEYNYTPSNLGGFFPFDLYTNTLSNVEINQLGIQFRPQGVQDGLIPTDLTNFITTEGRISPYVRFDNSQDLALNALSASDYVQEVVTPFGKVPDLVEWVENTHEDKVDFSSYNAQALDNHGQNKKACAFVKCSVDENFYMTPAMLSRPINVFGGSPAATPKVSKPSKIFIQCSGWLNGIPGSTLIPGSGCYVDSYRYNQVNWKPTAASTSTVTRFDFNRYFEPVLNSWIINTKREFLDTTNVYALITIPNKIVPTQKSRYRDSVLGDQNFDVHHFLTMDVVKGLPEFNNPGYKRPGPGVGTRLDAVPTTAEARSTAWLAARAAKRGLKYGAQNTMQYICPSPVYPDLVALPLISNDRCYGPWISTRVTSQGYSFKDIGGRVEFVKDENLNPWNYSGYDLMNEAGKLQADFTSNLLLFSERGGFTIPGYPSVSLGKALIDGGPLVTNISVEVGTGGIKTTYKMDLYTPSFGKLQKQKQELISKISRERQKIREERNALIRKGIGKSQSSFGIGNIVQMANMGGLDGISRHIPDKIVASLTSSNVPSQTPGGSFGSDGLYGASPSIFTTSDGFVNEVSMQTPEQLSNFEQQFDNNIDQKSAAADSAITKLSDKYIPFSNSEYHPSLPNKKNKEPNHANSFFTDFE